MRVVTAVRPVTYIYREVEASGERGDVLKVTEGREIAEERLFCASHAPTTPPRVVNDHKRPVEELVVVTKRRPKRRRDRVANQGDGDGPA